VPIINLLYDKQRVNIIANGQTLEGYEIKNGVKQGDSLSCILFIMCMDPLIRNIERNRPEVQGVPIPKVLAYADDIRCTLDNNINNLQMIFNEYDRLSTASGLILNADKTEILDANEGIHKITYRGEEHCLQVVKSVKINRIIFNKEKSKMKEENFNNLMVKINNMFAGWRARGLSLLEKILIYKTFWALTGDLCVINH